MHAHICACVKEYGPISSFWLYSFERYNGLLGDIPTNNRSIEVQLMQKFVRHSMHLQMFHTLPSGVVTDIFTPIFSEHCSLQLVKPASLNMRSTSNGFQFIPSSKYTIKVLNSVFCSDLVSLYSRLYYAGYSLVENDCMVPLAYCSMNDVTFKGDRICIGQYVTYSS